MNRSIAVLGIGKFGYSVAKSMARLGAEVMVVDRNEERVRSLQDEVTYAITAELSDADAIKGLGISNMDAVVVGMAMDLEASLMSVMVSKEEGVPFVAAKAANERMGEILKKVGADQIIYPEEEAGIRVARKLISNNFLEFFEISDTLCLVEMKPNKGWGGKTLRALDLRGKYKVNVVSIKGNDGQTIYPHPDYELKVDETLVLVVDKKELSKLAIDK